MFIDIIKQEAHGPWRSVWEPTWPFAKVPQILCSTPWVEIELIFTLRAAVSDIGANFQNCHIWAWNLAIGQSARGCTYTLFLPQGGEIELIFTLRVDFQNCHIWAWNLAIIQQLHISFLININPPPPQISLRFTLRPAFPWYWEFSILHYPIGHNAKKISIWNFKIPRKKFCVDCYREHSGKVWSKRNQNCWSSVLKFPLL